VEVRDAVGGRTFGAEDAMALPWSYSSPSPSSSSSGEGEGEGGGGNPIRRYATLSEEGRRTVSSAIVSALIEYDSDLAWADNTSTTGDDDDDEDEDEEEEAGNDGGKMRLSSLIDEVRARWRRSEGDDDDARPDLADEVVWHCLRPAVRRRGAAASASSASSSAGGGGGADDMPTFVRLLPDEVAGLCAHEAFLGAAAGQRVAEWWREEELLEAWSTRLPSMPSGYEPRTGLLRGVAVCRTTTVEEGGDDDDGDGEDGDATEDDRGGAIVSRRSRRGGGATMAILPGGGTAVGSRPADWVHVRRARRLDRRGGDSIPREVRRRIVVVVRRRGRGRRWEGVGKVHEDRGGRSARTVRQGDDDRGAGGRFGHQVRGQTLKTMRDASRGK
jgi:hypothetical protein